MSTATFEALVGNRTDLETLIGFEPLGRAARLVLFEELNDQIDVESERWHRADLALAELGLDPGIGQIEVEHVAPENLHEGPHRSLMDAPPESFPNVSVAGYAVVASPEQFDRLDSNRLTLFVESWATSGPIERDASAIDVLPFETILHRRIQRMTEAVAAVIRGSVDLLGTVNPIELPPRGGILNQSWLKSTAQGTGPRYLWQGSRLQYTLERNAALA